MAHTPASSRLKPVPHMHAVSQWDRLQPGRGQHKHRDLRGVTSDAFPAKAGLTKCTRSVSGTGFSREEARTDTANSRHDIRRLPG